MFRRYAIVGCALLATASAAYAAQQVVGQKDRLFSPGALKVKAGESVVFKNDDNVTHHVYSSTKGQEFDTETTKPGDSVSRTFTARGRVEVRCGLHPGMRLIVTVE